MESLNSKMPIKILAWFCIWRGFIKSLDPRLLIGLVSLGGSLAWLLPNQCLLLFVPLALVSAATVWVLLPFGRTALLLYSAFVFFWGISYFLLQLWENWAELALWSILYASLFFTARLFCIFAFAALLPLALSPLCMGRCLTWYIQRLALLEVWLCKVLLRGKLRPRLMAVAWKGGLCLTLMASFLPRSFRILRELSRNLRLRAPNLPLTRRLKLLGLAGLRLLGTQTWSMAVSIAVRDLYRPEPWDWQ